MVSPIHSSQPSYPSESPQDRQKLFELQWEISVLGTYLAVTRQNGQLASTASKIKNDIKSGAPADSISSDMNTLIDMINKKMPKNLAPFPMFSFTSGQSSPLESLRSYVMTFEKLLLTLRENRQLDPRAEASLWKEAQNVFDSVSKTSDPATVFHQLEALVESVNRHLPRDQQIPPLPAGLIGEKRR